MQANTLYILCTVYSIVIWIIVQFDNLFAIVAVLVKTVRDACSLCSVCFVLVQRTLRTVISRLVLSSEL